ncbi:MAG: FAD:protein FMN transferase [Bacteroidales bacterium]|nr:FAD:protein FMN transferase [Bacteroidales bacterium]
MSFPAQHILWKHGLSALGVPPGLFAEPPPTPELTLLRVSQRAMATTFEIAFPYGTPDAIAAAEDAFELIDTIEDQLTVYRSHSVISTLNVSAMSGFVTVEPGLFDLLRTAATITQETAGAFDITIGSLIKAWGFFRREGCVPPAAELKRARTASGMKHVLLDAETSSVKYRVPGLELNLGAIGKGYALDRAGERLRTRWGISSALLQAGGSSVLALGTPPGQPAGWPVTIRHPTNDHRTLGTIRLSDQALGTSAATFQYFMHKGRRLGHLLDPRTGWPAQGTACASVVTQSATVADALSTAFFVLGPTESRAFCRSRPHLAAVLLPDTVGAEPGTVNLTAHQYLPPGPRDVFLAHADEV